MSVPAVRLTDVSKKFILRSERRDSLKERAVRGRVRSKKEEFWALRDASFEVPKGSCFGLVGHNGSGKSTTLKVMAGIYRPTSGTVEVNGRISALLELGAGFHHELTGRENIALNGALLGMTRAEIDASTDEIIEFAGLDDFIDAPVKVYSSGMYVRLGFSIAVAVKPEVLVVDEVIAVGDEEFQRRCFDHFHELRGRGATVILVSHGLPLMSELCDEAIWIDHGRIAAHGDARRVVASYLESVNDAESVVDEAGLLHVGKGGATVTGLDFLHADSGEAAGHLTTGQPCRFRVHLLVHRRLERAVIGLNFFSDNDIEISGPNTLPMGWQTVEPGPLVIDFEVPELLLNPGQYEVSVGISADAAIMDHVHRAFTLRVHGDGSFSRGLFRMPGDWVVRLGQSRPVNG